MKKIKKTRIVSIILAVCCALSFFVGCKNEDSSSSGSGTSETPVAQEKEIPKELDVVMCEGGLNYYTIVTPSGYDANITSAKDELQYFYKDGTGLDMPAIFDDKAGGFSEDKKYISLGRTSLAEDVNLDVTAASSMSDGYVIKTVGNSIFVCGTTSAGTLYGVYELLEYMLGLKIYALDEWAINKTDTVKLRDYDIATVPSVETRSLGIWYEKYPEILEKRLRLGHNAGDGFISWGHTSLSLLPPKTYKAEHPDWYNEGASQLCFSNQEMIEEMKKVVIEKIEKWSFGSATIAKFMIGHEDTNAYCECANCTAIKNQYDGKASAIEILFINQIQRHVNAWMEENRPGKTVKMIIFGYGPTVEPPVRKNADGTYTAISQEVIVEKNVGVMLAPLGADWAHSLTDAKYNASSEFSINGWPACNAELYIWTYNCVFDDQFIVMDHWTHLKESYQTFIDKGAVYIFDQGKGHKNLPLYNLNNYVSSQLLWDITQDTEVLIDEFMNAYYKVAAPFVREYFNAYRIHYKVLEAEAEARGESFKLTSYVRTQPLYTDKSWWSKTWLLNTIDILDKAIAAAETISDPEIREKVLYRVRTERLGPAYQLMSLYNEELTDKEKQYWINELQEVSDHEGITGYREHSGEMQNLLNTWRTWVTDSDN